MSTVFSCSAVFALLTRGGMLKALAENIIIDVAKVKSDLRLDGCSGPNIGNTKS